MYRKRMREALEEARSYRDPVNEDKGFSSQQIKMAYGVLNDPRYKQGNYSGAYKAIEKIARGLASHPDVANALKRANEELDNDDKETIKPIIKQLQKSVKAHDKQAKQLQKDIQDEVELEEAFTLADYKKLESDKYVVFESCVLEYISKSDLLEIRTELYRISGGDLYEVRIYPNIMPLDTNLKFIQLG